MKSCRAVLGLAGLWLASSLAVASECHIFSHSFEADEPAVEACADAVGTVFKGPFQAGSTVTLTVLDESLEPTGVSYTGTVSDNLGQFSVAADVGTGPIQISATGAFFNEVSGGSSAPVTLRAITRARPGDDIHINVFSTIETDRLKALVASGQTLAEAKATAIDEIFNELFGLSAPASDSTDISLTSSGGDALLALSALVLTGNDGAAATEAQTEQLISLFTQDLADGVIGNLNGANLSLGLSSLPAVINANGIVTQLAAHYDAQGQTVAVPSISSALTRMRNQHSVSVNVSVVGEGSVDQAGTNLIGKGGGFELALTPAADAYLQTVTSSCGGRLRDNNNRYVIDDITSDCDVEATFATGGITLTFDSNGGSAVSPITLLPGTDIATPSEPTRTGHSFTGWSPSIPNTMPDADLTVTAQWAINDYTLSFDTDGNPGADASTQLAFGASLPTIPNPTRQGHTFTGWSPSVPSTMPAEDLLLTAEWIVNSYVLSYNTAGGADLQSETIPFGDSILPLLTPSRIGYEFVRWKDRPPGDVMPAKDVELIAEWEAKSFTISFDGNGGSATDPVTAEFDSDTSNIVPPDPVREGYTFAGWDPAFPSTMPASDINLRATWTPNPITIRFDTGGGTPLPDIDTVAEESIEFTAEPTRSGYHFVGWDPTFPDKMPLSDQTYTAVWSPKIYALSLDKQDGSDTRTELSVTFDDTVPAITPPSRDGYIFSGFFSQPERQGEYWFDTTGDSTDDKKRWKETRNVVVYADWTPKTTSIIFSKNASETQFATTIYQGEFGTDVPEFGTPTREGYVFAGWNPEIPETMPATNLTVSPTWVKRQFELTLIDRSTDPNTVTIETVPYSDAPNVTSPTRTGYSFDRWEPALPSTMPAKNSSHYAVWSPQSYTISFDDQGGTGGPTRLSVNYDANPASITPPARGGFEFAGYWTQIQRQGEMVFDPFGNPAKAWDIAANATLYAAWNTNIYTLAFDSNGGSGVAPELHQAGDSISAPTPPTRLGYTFNGWRDADGNAFTFPTTMPASNLTLTAQWTADTYSAILVDEPDDPCLKTDPHTCTTATLTYGQTVPDVSVPTRTGFEFLGYWLQPLSRSGQTHSDAGAGQLVWDYTDSASSYDSTENVFYLFADWQGLDFTLDFDLGYTPPSGSNITTPNAITQRFDTPIAAPADPSREGHAFDGWSDGGGNAGIPAKMPAENRTYTAQWTKNSYTITFDSDGGSAVSAVSVDFGDSITLPTNPTRTGFTFDDWADVDGNPLPNTMPARDLSVVAQWSPSTYTVSLDHQGGTSTTNAVTATFNALLPQADAPTKANNTFAGYWTQTNGGGEQYYQVDMTPNQAWTVDANTTLYAHWIPDTQYTVNVVETPAAGGSTTGTGTYFENTTVTLEATPSSGYEFVGWYESDAQVSASETYSYTATRNRNLVARFTQPPTAPVIRVLPKYPSANFDLTCHIQTAATDPDGDDIAYEYVWTRQVNESAPAEVMTSHTSQTVPASATSTDEIWSCEARAHDGWVLSPASSCENFDLEVFRDPWAVSTDCGRKVLLDDYCSGGPCENGGQCNENADIGTYECDCSALPEWTGDRCDLVDACALMEAAGRNPCGDFGTCVNQNGGFDCSCDPDFACACCNGLIFPGVTCALQGLTDTGGWCETADEIEAVFGPFRTSN